MLTAGCGTGTGGDGSTRGASSDDDASGGSGADASATSSGSVSADGSGTGGECPPNSVYAVPGCGAEDPGLIPVPEAGCYEVCMDGDSTLCTEGSCINAWIDPCHDSPCGACGDGQWLCIAGEPLAPGFESELQVVDGCGSTSFSVFAANSDGDVLLSVSVSGGLVEAAQMSGMAQQEVFGLPNEEVTVRARTGSQVAGDACNDAPFGTILRSYEGVAGTVDATFEPAAMGSGDEGIATVLLTDVELQQTSGAGDSITIASFAFEAVPIWCCPG